MNDEIKTLVCKADKENIIKAAGIIKAGGLAVFPTETVYGLGANALDPEAAKKIYAAKGRPSDNPLIIHLADFAEAEKYVYTCGLFYKLAEIFMPGPLTVILPKRAIIPREVTGGLDTAAIRVPSNTAAFELIKAAEVPIAAPSANLSGKPSPTSVNHVIEDLFGKVDIILDGGDSEIGLESTVVKINSENNIILLRPGKITYEELLSVCGDVEIGASVTENFEGKPSAPGMKYRHYAPDAKVYLLDGEDEKIYEYLKNILTENCGVLCYDEDLPHITRGSVISVGSKNNYEEQARSLFRCLREFKSVGIIYARMPGRGGMGLAVYNRLIKAAGFEVIKL